MRATDYSSVSSSTPIRSAGTSNSSAQDVGDLKGRKRSAVLVPKVKDHFPIAFQWFQ